MDRRLGSLLAICFGMFYLLLLWSFLCSDGRFACGLLSKPSDNIVMFSGSEVEEKLDEDLQFHEHLNGFESVVWTGESAVVGFASCSEMATQIHNMEQEAYISVLRAFVAQSDALNWEKESLIAELRKELRVSDEKHREILSRVHADHIIHRIREYRNSNAQPSPIVSASRNEQKTWLSVPRVSSDAFAIDEPEESGCSDPLIGRRVWLRWPEDNNLYQAAYNPIETPPEDIKWDTDDPGTFSNGDGLDQAVKIRNLCREMESRKRQRNHEGQSSIDEREEMDLN